VHVRHAILQLFFGEAVKEDGKISVLVKPDFDFAMELLQVFGEQNPNLTIHHLFCMNNNEKMVSMRKNYNLSCLQKILPICACGCDYRAWYYYDNVAARLNEFRLFPYLILTEHCALAFSADYQNAILFREETTLRMMREMFEGYLKQSEPLFERLDTVQSQLGYTETLIRHFVASDSPRYFFQRMPCLSGLLTAEMLELVQSGYENIVCAQPFGCLPNHICGKGMVNKIRELYPEANITPIDYDPSATRVNQENRIKLMLAVARERLPKFTGGSPKAAKEDTAAERQLQKPLCANV